MCFSTVVLCGICQTPIGRHMQTICDPQLRDTPNHRVCYYQPYTLYPSAPYACPNKSCVANTELHWTLRDQQAAAMQQGTAKLDYVPFSQVKAMCGDNDEACDLALEPAPINRPTRPRLAPPAPETVPVYPPQRVFRARLTPRWLSYNQWRTVCELLSGGKNILAIARVVNKNASLLRTYVDTYLKDLYLRNAAPFPSASSTDSTAGSTESDGGLFPLDHEIISPQPGMPEPGYLNRREQEVVWRMFQQNDSIRNMTERLHKHRHKLSQYINAYLRPKLLKLQAEERDAEERMAATPTYATPLIGGILDQNPVPEPVAPITTGPESKSSRDPGLHSINSVDSDAFLGTIDPLFINPVAGSGTEDPRTGELVALVETTRSASDEDSLFGDSPVDPEDSSCTQFEGDPAPATSNKRKIEDYSEQAEPGRASKRLRQRSLP